MASTTPISAMVSTVGPKATREVPQPLEQATGRNPSSRTAAPAAISRSVGMARSIQRRETSSEPSWRSPADQSRNPKLSRPSTSPRMAPAKNSYR